MFLRTAIVAVTAVTAADMSTSSQSDDQSIFGSFGPEWHTEERPGVWGGHAGSGPRHQLLLAWSDNRIGPKYLIKSEIIR